MAIQKVNADVYFAPTRNRRYFSRQAAIEGEAMAIILKKYPIEPFESDTGAGYDIRVDEPERYEKMHRRMCRVLKQYIPVVGVDMAATNPVDLQDDVEKSIAKLLDERKLRYCSDSLEFVEGLKIGLEIAGLYGDGIKDLYSKSSITTS